jgi:lipoate-protein ligase A
MHDWLLLQSGPGDHAFNMALDEALLEAMPRLGKPVLRFYGWLGAPASFGYFQKIADVESMTLLRPLVRRPTAGGIVPHDADWTYSLVFPTPDEWYSLSATESYRCVHEWIRSAFTRMNVETQLAPRSRRGDEADSTNPSPHDLGSHSHGGQCFVGYEKSDLLWRGRKIAGAAQRRTRAGLLIQGSVQPPPLSLAKADWQKAMCDVAHFDFGVRWTELELDTPLREHAEELAAAKYCQASYNRKR